MLLLGAKYSRRHLVKGEQVAPTLTTDAPIPHTGIYRVIHAEHRLPHEVILFKEEKFPRCSKCQDRVRFELVYPAEEIYADSSFRVVVHELPGEELAA